ncbi:MAG: hypothetical protein ACOX5Z_00240 [Desulfobulbus sp.]|jgi:hypothetical protein
MAAGVVASVPWFCPPTVGRGIVRAAQPFVLGLPPRQDVGHVTAPRKVVIWLWNGSTSDAVLTAITPGGDSEGVSWDTTPPLVVRALRSARSIITVGPKGPLVFEALLTYTSSCRTLTLCLTGTRAPQLAGDIGYLFMPHDWTGGLAEELAWKTEVLVAHDRTEQRIQLRTHPRRSWDLHLLVDGARRRKLESWLGLRKTRFLLTPVWRDESRLREPVSAGQSVVYLPDPLLHDYAPDRPMAVYADWDRFEIRTVAGVGNDYVAVDAPFAGDWPLGTLAAPCRYGLSFDPRRVERFTEDVALWRLRFEARGEGSLPTLAEPELYQGQLVCPLAPSWAEIEEARENKWVRLDTDMGRVEYDIQSIEPVQTRTALFVLTNRQRIDTFLRFLAMLRGRLVPFWLPSPARGLEPAVPAAVGETTLLIQPIDYEFALSGSAAHAHIELVTTGGITIRRAITGITTLPDGTEQLALDEPLPCAVSRDALARSAWLELCRLDSDAVNLQWFGGDCLETRLPIVVLP